MPTVPQMPRPASLDALVTASCRPIPVGPDPYNDEGAGSSPATPTRPRLTSVSIDLAGVVVHQFARWCQDIAARRCESTSLFFVAGRSRARVAVAPSALLRPFCAGRPSPTAAMPDDQLKRSPGRCCCLIGLGGDVLGIDGDRELTAGSSVTGSRARNDAGHLGYENERVLEWTWCCSPAWDEGCQAETPLSWGLTRFRRSPKKAVRGP